MKKQAYPVTRLTGGQDVSVDAIFLTDQSSPYLRNVRFSKGMIKKGLGKRTFGTGLPLEGTVMYIDTFMTSGTVNNLMCTPKWIYKYDSTTDTYTKKNSQVTTGAIALTFVASTKKITRGSGSFVTDGFTSGTIITTNATLNPGPFTAVTVAALEIVVTETVVDEGPVTKTATGVVPLTGDEDYQFSSVMLQDAAGADLYALTNGKDYIQKYDGGSGNLANLAGWVTAEITGKRLASHSSRLVVGHTIESGTICPRRVRWSISGDVEDCTGTGSGFVDLVETSDWIVAVMVLKGKLYVIKEKSIWELVYVGGTEIYRPELRIGGIGTYSPNSVANLGEEIIFYGFDNIYLYDGINPVPIAKNIHPHLYATETKIVNSEKVNRSPGVYIEELGVYALCLPTQGDVPDLLAEYYFEEKSWTLRNRSVTAFGYYTVPSGDKWSELTGTWAAQTWTWMERTLQSGAPTVLMGDSDGYVYEDNRITKSTEPMCVDTKDWIFGHAERIVEFRAEVKGGPFTCSYSLDGGESWSGTKTFAVSSSWQECVWFLNLTTQKFRVRLESSAEDFDIIWMEPWYIPRQRSKGIATS